MPDRKIWPKPQPQSTHPRTNNKSSPSSRKSRTSSRPSMWWIHSTSTSWREKETKGPKNSRKSSKGCKEREKNACSWKQSWQSPIKPTKISTLPKSGYSWEVSAPTSALNNGLKRMNSITKCWYCFAYLDFFKVNKKEELLKNKGLTICEPIAPASKWETESSHESNRIQS